MQMTARAAKIAAWRSADPKVYGHPKAMSSVAGFYPGTHQGKRDRARAAADRFFPAHQHLNPLRPGWKIFSPVQYTLVV